MNKFLIIMAAIMMLGGCKSKKTVSDDSNTSDQIIMPAIEITPGLRPQKGSSNRREVATMPGAIIYKTKHDYSNNVPVELDGRRKALKSYPDPIDISEASTPLPLADGFLLDRRGIGNGVAFTSYTYTEYANLTSAPSPEQLLAKVIDKNPLAAMYKLPININEATADTAKVNDIIRNGLKDCVTIIPDFGSIKLKQE